MLRYPSFSMWLHDEKRRAYAAMITALDDQVGRIVAALEKTNMRDNALIMFSSDNGGAIRALFATGARSEAERKAEGLGVTMVAQKYAGHADNCGAP